MRNVFLLLILTIFIFSLCSLMWKSLLEAKLKPEENKETTRVEKLVKGDNSIENNSQQLSQENFEMPAFPQVDFRQMKESKPQFDSSIEKPQSVQIKNEQVQSEEIKPTNLAVPKENEIMLKDVTPEQIQAINSELTRKYGNNPNAEVSEEDLRRIIEMFIDTKNR